MLPQKNHCPLSSAKYAVNLEYFVSGILYALKKEKAFQSYRMWIEDKVLCKIQRGKKTAEQRRMLDQV